MTNALIIDIHRHQTQQSWLIDLSTRHENIFQRYALIITEANQERHIELYSYPDHTSLVRWTSTSIFTKRKPTPPPELTGYRSVLAELFAAKDGFMQNNRENVDLKLNSGSLPPQQTTAIQKIKRRIKTVRKSLQRQHGLARDEASLTALEQQTGLLAQFIHEVEPQTTKVLLRRDMTGLAQDIEIPLDPQLSIGGNIDCNYQEIKRIRRGLATHSDQIKKTQQNLSELQQLLARLQQEILTPTELTQQLKQFHLSAESVRKHPGRERQTLAYKLYRSGEGTLIKVGKGASANDELTERAKANDFWIHAVGHSGSHVVVDGGKFRQVDLPARIFRDAAILALHYSKARESREGEVYCTRRAKISKKKGMPPGLWNVELADTIMVRYSEEELKTVLDQREDGHP